ncbi:MAG: DNA polymerase Y family protein, partial [Motiliproteus sp.]|nr:DNA polymerase Y family protein [Motiliproteus sp.]
MSTLWLYLHFPLLPLEVLYHSDESGPSALLDERRARLWLCNTTAEAEGLKTGMAVATARSLCPQIQLLNRQPQQESQQLQTLALWANRFSAQISLRSDHGLLLEIASMLPYFKGFNSFYRHLRQQLQKLGFSSLIATGHTPLAARMLARDGGFIHRESEPHQQALAQLPVSALELDNKTTERLTGMGLRQVRQLLDLPRDELASRLGSELLERVDRLTGQQPEPIEFFVPPAHFCQRLDLQHEVETSQGLLFPLKRILAALEGYLHSRQLRAQQLQLQLFERASLHSDQQPRQLIELNHADGEYRTESWLELWRLRFERLHLQRPIIALELTAELFNDQKPSVNDLFHSTRQQPGMTPQQLLTRLHSRLGKQAIKRIVPHADHRPEKSWKPLEATSLPTPSTESSFPPGQHQRPGWLLA